MLIKEVSSRCSVSPAEVKEYHAAHQSEFTEGEKAHVSQIWIKEMPEKPGEAERLSKELLNRLNNGERFPDLAKKYSQCPYAAGGGDWGVVGRGHLNKEIEDAAFSLSPGGHSGVIKTGLGYHIVMLHERKPPVVTPLEKVYAEIENKIFADKVTARRDEWIKKLKKTAYISVVK
ncbi:MAG: peptidylprolyl isomerase, partial [Candidatus Aureabacteria bacterium]|nr:peptidylprolyl isomerase [Candidatus Auribacterota bacterium]